MTRWQTSLKLYIHTLAHVVTKSTCHIFCFQEGKREKSGKLRHEEMETQKENINRILSMKYGRTHPGCAKKAYPVHSHTSHFRMFDCVRALNFFIRKARIRVVQAPIPPKKKSRWGENPSLDLSGKKGETFTNSQKRNIWTSEFFSARPLLLLCCTVDTLGSKNMVNPALLLRSR